MITAAPRFWFREAGTAALLLSPFSALWRAGTALRRVFARPYISTLPVICVGNVVAGGAGKTPACIALLAAMGAQNPCFLTRGYGGSGVGAALLGLNGGDAHLHGDEAVLLARHAPVVVSRDRAAGLKLAEKLGFDLVIADDGFQNPGFHKTASVLVFDGAAGIGNGKCIPAGPCREPLQDAVRRADAAIVVGDDKTSLSAHLAPLPVFAARIAPARVTVGDMRCVAFAGIGRPEKFFATLRDAGYQLAETVSFPDHHRYSTSDLARLEALARQHDARLITTEKDHVRLPQSWQGRTDTLPIKMHIDDIDALAAALRTGRA